MGYSWLLLLIPVAILISCLESRIMTDSDGSTWAFPFGASSQPRRVPDARTKKRLGRLKLWRLLVAFAAYLAFDSVLERTHHAHPASKFVIIGVIYLIGEMVFWRATRILPTGTPRMTYGEMYLQEQAKARAAQKMLAARHPVTFAALSAFFCLMFIVMAALLVWATGVKPADAAYDGVWRMPLMLLCSFLFAGIGIYSAMETGRHWQRRRRG